MTLIRFKKERARLIIFDKDPGFKVLAYGQTEIKKGVYNCSTIIKELRTGKFFKSEFRSGVEKSEKQNLKPFDCDEPLFREVEL